ncbi:hypothetical protein LJC26_06655 [Desulfovibrio sp. OttesenSCG-928-O18]|nr:hypothetical protein [Desulfovibrio sp. OttesenSCG-928-O18]
MSMHEFDLSTRISFYTFDDDEVIDKKERKPIRHRNPEEYVLLHESDITSLHNDMYDVLEAFYLVLEYASQNNGDARGYYENLSLIFKRLTRIGNLLDADLMKEQHKQGPGQNIKAVFIA